MDNQSGEKRKEIKTSIAVLAIIAALALMGIIIWMFVNGDVDTGTISSTSGGKSNYSYATYSGTNRYYSVNLVLRSNKTFDMEMTNVTNNHIVHKLYGTYEFVGSGRGISAIAFTLPDGTVSSCTRMIADTYEYISLSGLEEWFPTVYKN